MITFLRRLLAVLSPQERRAFFGRVAMTIATGFLDALSIASVIPFLALLLDPIGAGSNPAVIAIQQFLGMSSTQSLLVSAGYLLIFFTATSVIFRIMTVYVSSRFTNMCSYRFQRRLMMKYISKPYIWFLSNNSSDLSKSILSEVEIATNQVLKPAMDLLAAGTSALAISAILLVSHPLVSLAALGLFGLSYLASYGLLRPRLAHGSHVRFVNNALRFKMAQEAFGSVRDIKLMGLEDEFLRRFERPARTVARTRATIDTIGLAPRYAVEGLAIIGALILVLAMTGGAGVKADGASTTGMIATMGLFAFAAVRLFPALQMIYRATTQIRSGMPAFDSLYEDLRTAPETERAAPAPAGEAIRAGKRLELADLVFTYPGADRPALRGLSLAIEANTTVALVGGTGAGKTTIVDIVLGLLEPQEGDIRVDGRRIGRADLRAWQNQIGYVPQSIFLTDDSVAANIALGQLRERIDPARVERAARIARLHDFVVDELPQGYDTVVGERGVRLSGGQRQRIGIARALYHDPSLLVLDEATSALDNLTERAVMDAVDALSNQKTIIMIAHRLSTVRRCDRIFMIEQGRVSASGTYEELFDHSAAFKKLAEVGA